VPHLVAVPGAGSRATASVLSTVTTHWVGAPCADRLGPSGRFGCWAKLVVPGCGLTSNPTLFMCLLISRILFLI
jgi:hypothetical protein